MEDRATDEIGCGERYWLWVRHINRWIFGMDGLDGISAMVCDRSFGTGAASSGEEGEALRDEDSNAELEEGSA